MSLVNLTHYCVNIGAIALSQISSILTSAHEYTDNMNV